MNEAYKLLVVDDELIILDGLQSFYWDRFHFKVIGTAANGKQAMELMQQEAADVILTDIKMPVMDGIELSIELRKHFPNVKIVILTGYKEFDYAQKAIQAGVYEYLLKPIDLRELEEMAMKLKLLLDAEKKSSKQLFVYEKQLAQSLPSARNQFFFSLLEESVLELHDIEEQMNLLEIELNRACYCCAVIKLESPIGDPGNKLHLADPTKHMIEQQLDNMDFNCHILNQFSKEFIIILLNFDSSSLLPRQDVIQILEQLRNNIQSKTDYASFIGLGEVYSSILSLPQSFRQARDTMNRNFFQERQGLFLWNEPAGAPATNWEYPYLLETHILDAILEGDPENSLRQFQEFWVKCCMELDRLELTLIHKSILSLLTMLERRLNLHNTSLEKLVQIPTPFTDFIEQIQTLSKLKIALEQLILKSAQQIKKLNEDVQTTSYTAVQQVKKYIEEHYSNKITLNQMAELVYLNSSYFSIQFKKEAGINFVDYLKRFRIEKAKELLHRIDLKVYEIGEMVGYQDRKYFTNTFKNHTKLTPLEYRQTYITY